MLRNKAKPRVFLAALAVASRTDIKRYIDEQPLIYRREDLEDALRKDLSEIFDLPPASTVESPLKTDLGLDVVITKYQLGDAWIVSMPVLELPIFWRPKIEIHARLFFLQSDKTLKTLTVTESITWKSFISRIFTWRAMFRFRTMYDQDDLRSLLNNASVRLLKGLI